MKKRKIQGAREKVAEAEKHLKTSLLKWTPSYLLAEKKYASAALDLKIVGEEEAARDLYLLAVDCAEKGSSTPPYTIAEYLETAAKINLKSKTISKTKIGQVEAIDLLDQAVKLFLKSGENHFRAAKLKVLAAEAHQKLGQDAAFTQNVKEAFDIVHGARILATGLDVLVGCIDTMIKHDHIDMALDMTLRFCTLCREAGRASRAYPYYAVISILYCHMGDPVAAEEAFMEHLQDDGFVNDTRNITIAEDTWTAFSNRDEVKLAEMQKSSLYNHLPVQAMYLAKRLSIFGSDDAEAVEDAADETDEEEVAAGATAGSAAPAPGSASAEPMPPAAAATTATRTQEGEAEAKVEVEAEKASPAAPAATAEASAPVLPAAAHTVAAVPDAVSDSSDDEGDEGNWFG